MHSVSEAKGSVWLEQIQEVGSKQHENDSWSRISSFCLHRKLRWRDGQVCGWVPLTER